MNRFCLCVSLLLVLSFVVPGNCDDRQKAQGMLGKVSGMTADPAGKRAVSRASAELLSLDRAHLVRSRQEMNLNYGDLFLMYQLVKSGIQADDIAAEIKNGKPIWSIASERHANWKELINETKRLNNKIDANLIAHFANRKAGPELDKAEGYDPLLDSVKADAQISQKDIDDAQKRYLFLRDHSSVPFDSTLDTSTERSARMVRTDPVRTGGPSNPDVNTRPRN
jgi:hypothetical protein